MAEERGWDAKRRSQEQARALDFLQSMGLPSVEGAADVESGFFTTMTDRARSLLHLPPATRQIEMIPLAPHGRAEFEAGEVDTLRDAFDAAAKETLVPKGEPTPAKAPEVDIRLPRDAMHALLRSLPEYARAREGELRSVLDETGLGSRTDFDFNDFVEVSGFQSFYHDGWLISFQ